MIKILGGVMKRKYIIPKNLIILISGVPGVGKTTISNELLNGYKEFRLVEETDILRDILRGYNQFISSEYKITIENIYPHNVFLTYEMSKEQCKIMRQSIINIIKRQQRKGIPSIINGVHIIPEELCSYLLNSNIIYINLYIDSEKALWNRLKKRNPQKYKAEFLPLLYQTNLDLKNSIDRLKDKIICYNINISRKSIFETINEIDMILYNLYKF